MEILKFWTTPTTQNSINSSSSTTFDYSDDEEQDDSFFELDFNSFKNNEPTSKPTSPISILKSSPKFRIFMVGFGFSKSRKTGQNKAASTENNKFISDESKFLSIFSKVKSSRSCNSKMQKQGKNVGFSSPIESSKRIMHRYLNLVKPFNVNDSPVMKNSRLGKSRSTSAAAASKRDDSVWQQHDGIESAIVHCKRSYNSSRAGILEESWRKISEEEEGC